MKPHNRLTTANPLVAGAPRREGRLASAFSGIWQKVGEWPFWARELIRKSLHIGVVVMALPLRWFGFYYGIAFAAVAFIWNAFGMPRYFRFTFREEEHQNGYSRGMLSYPVTVLMLMLVFPLPIAASQWATLSFGDGFATLIGRFLGKRHLPWNRDKTFEGMAAFLVMGSIGAMFFFWFTLANIQESSFLWAGSPLLAQMAHFSILEVVSICVLSTMVAAFCESLPLPYIDDNVIAPLAGALTKLALCYVL